MNLQMISDQSAETPTGELPTTTNASTAGIRPNDLANAGAVKVAGQHPALVSEAAAQAYILKRLVPQISWFDTKALTSKRLHYIVFMVSLAATSLIVVANSLELTIVSTLLAVIAALSTGASHLAKFQEHWIRYRKTAAALEVLKLRYEIGVPPFDDENKHGSIIDEVEKILAQEQAQWRDEFKHPAKQVPAPNDETSES